MTFAFQHPQFKPCIGLLAPSIQTMHRTNAVVIDSGRCSVFFVCVLFFTFSAGICFPEMSMWCYCFWPTDVWGSGSGSLVALPSLDPLKIYAAKQTQNAEFTGWKSAIGRMPAAKFHSVPNFRHILFLAGRNREMYWVNLLCSPFEGLSSTGFTQSCALI